MAKGIIFDMDGVLFDTEVLYEKFWILAATKLGYNMTLDDVASIRSTDAKIAKETLKARIGSDFDYENTKALRIKLMKEYTDREGVIIKDGVVIALEYLKSKGYKIALATTSNQNRATDFLKKGKIYSYFDFLMTGDMVSNCKPHPEIYLKAAEGLVLNPTECYAVEDSYNGIRSAYKAGCKVIMVPDRDVVTDECKEKCDAILTKIDEIINIL